jgi:NADH-quinone oxidoreductase subunit L
MNPHMLLAIPLSPLAAAIIAGLFGRVIGRAGAALITIAGVAVSCALAGSAWHALYFGGVETWHAPVYQWLLTDGVNIHVGFLVDRLTALMMLVVTFVSLCVHIYTMGYMRDDPGYQRFFSYISLFTFSMLMLVMSDNFMQLFFGWEAVGVVSYLLIGFWYTRPSAIFANLKAFLVNRIGDFGFLLGIAAILYHTGSLDYAVAFKVAPTLPPNVMTFICICLFIGAMGKSAQVPLHVWLPDSMEGPTPISALIHAATMVTAGIFMVARMSPLFEYSETALSFVLIIGATTALFMGFLGVVNNDIKRVVAYSTLSQLGYMTVALGASAYSVAIFHLMTHAFFKALLFLAAGAVIVAMHHEQDMRKMGGLKARMPVTYWTCLIGALALIGTPFFSGFYSKDALIEAVHESHRYGSGYAYFCVLAGVFFTALYTFRMIFLTFHGKSRLDHHAEEHFHDVHWDMKGPLVALAIPSVLIGYIAIAPLLFGDYFGSSIFVREANNVVGEIGEGFSGPVAFVAQAFQSWPLYIAAAGVFTAWLLFLKRPELADACAARLGFIRRILDNKYYFDWFNENVIARAARLLGTGLWKGGDGAVIDGVLIDGSAHTVGRIAGLVRQVQSGYLYSYAFWMIVGLVSLLGWFLWRVNG